MRKMHGFTLIACGLLVLFLAACRPSAPAGVTPTPSFTPVGAAFTQAAATLFSQQTRLAVEFKSPTPSNTPEPTSTRTITPTVTRTSRPTATRTLRPTETITPSQTPFGAYFQTPNSSGKLCNAAEFIEDVTIKDNARIPPGVGFVKTWRLKNVGSCTWAAGYSAVFVNRDLMGASRRVSIPGDVKPGKTVDISIEFTAPMQPGEYQGNWMLSDQAGHRFGTGVNADGVFWVRIKVVLITPTPSKYYEFAANVCNATWVATSGSLPCVGSINDPRGWVLVLNNPDLEYRHEDQPGIWTNPPLEDGGVITGTFTSVPVHAGDHFVADISCIYGYEDCNVNFQVKYSLRDGEPKSLGVFKKVYDKSYIRIDIDLADIGDRSNVTFYLIVGVNRYPDQAAAFWLNPYVGPPPSP